MTNYKDYESGPFCRHWGDPGDCEACRAGCAACGHSGFVHDFGKPGACNEAWCECAEWVDKEELE